MKRKHAGSSGSRKRSRTSSRRKRRTHRRRRSSKRSHSRSRSRLVGFRATRMLGQVVGSSKCKQRSIDNSSGVDMDTRTFYTNELIAVTHGEDPDQRLTNKINCRGIQIHMELKNNRGTAINIHFAIVSPRDGDSATAVDWFKGYGQNRNQNFSGANTTNMEMNTLPVNTDKFLLLKRFTIQLAGNTEANTIEDAGDTMSYRHVKFYQAINRQLRFSSTSATTPETGKVFLVMWACPQCSQDLTQDTDGIRRSIRTILCFREPKN